ncbi:MAG: hypothetical protein KGD59_05585 [Candidatus Heimdallarchaeota archaeon]|nr:hypothetical protein [Candidatus Heimdallarchaeota archaeon]MBY8994003.1 hypothetical protein [Candidatus Heimdallarchaeota archaeon]
MIAITKEFKQLLQEMFELRGVTEIAADDLVEVLSVNKKELEKLLKDESVREEFKLVKAKDGSDFVKRYLNERLEGKLMTSTFDIRWDNIDGCPCFTCYELDRCNIGNPISSVDCPLFSKWLFKDPDEEKEK